MPTATRTTRILFTLIGLALLVLGILFWIGQALSLIPLHVVLGGAFVLCMWVLVALAFGARKARGFAIGVLVWSFVVLILGMAQARLLPGPLHWIVQTAHLLVGLIALGLGHALAARLYARRGVAVDAAA